MMLIKHSSSQKSSAVDFYVGVSSPQNVRRELLLASKDVLDVLRKVELLKSLRQEKEKVQSQLRLVFEELIVLNKELRALLPKSAVPAMPEPKVVVPIAQVEDSPEESKHKSRLQRLEEELASIETKLSALE